MKFQLIIYGIILLLSLCTLRASYAMKKQGSNSENDNFFFYTACILMVMAALCRIGFNLDKKLLILAVCLFVIIITIDTLITQESYAGLGIALLSLYIVDSDGFTGPILLSFILALRLISQIVREIKVRKDVVKNGHNE